MTKITFFDILFKETLIKIHQIEFVGRSRECRIEPAQHITRHRLVAKETPVDKNRLPLTTLRLVASDRIGKLYLHCIEVGILAYLLETLDFTLDVEVILLHLKE